jgi:hypothetical protein
MPSCILSLGMDSVTTTLVPIFATPFAAVPLPVAAQQNARLLALFAERVAEQRRHGGGSPEPLCVRGRDDLLEWREEPAKILAVELLGGVCAVVAAASQFSDEQFDALRVQARGWFTIVRPDGCVPATSYPVTSWCAVYCVAAPEPAPARPDSGVLRLYETRNLTMFLDAANSAMRAPFSHGHLTWQPVPGHMAVFPASTLHEIALVRSRGELVLVTVRARFASPSQDYVPPW